MAVTSSRRDVLHFGCATAAALGVSALGPTGALAQGAPASNASAEDFFYREDWFGEPWRKPETAVLIHGNAESSIVWYAWMPRMAQEFRVLRPDLPGFGRSRIPAGFAWSLPSLVAARALQGLGASGIMAVNTALVRFIYPGHLQGRGFGYNAMVVATAFTLGPAIASGILAVGPWSWLFAVNIPFGLVAILIGLKTLPGTPRATHAFDFLGAPGAAWPQIGTDESTVRDPGHRPRGKTFRELIATALKR